MLEGAGAAGDPSDAKRDKPGGPWRIPRQSIDLWVENGQSLAP